MSLARLMAQDMRRTVARSAGHDFAEAATLVPDTQGEAGVGFPVVVVFTDPTVTPGVIEIGDEVQDRRAECLGVLSVIRAGFLAAEGAARDPRRGDFLRIADGAHAGTWTITEPIPDIGDGVVLKLRDQQLVAAAANGVREVD